LRPHFRPAILCAGVPQGLDHKFFPGENQSAIGRYICDQMRAPYFPVETETWWADTRYLPPKRRPEVEHAFKVRCFNVHHPGKTYGYRIDATGKSIVYVSDSELGFIAKSIDKRMAEFDHCEQTLLEEMKREEKDRAIEFMSGVDLLIHDAQYTPEDCAHKHGWGHSCYLDTVNFAIEANVKNLFLFHHDPNYDDEMVAQIHQHSLELVKEKGSSLECLLAVEGLSIDLDD
jgi:phosphoribosyl 1,2-cyclic phosphodiesterase